MDHNANTEGFTTASDVNDNDDDGHENPNGLAYCTQFTLHGKLAWVSISLVPLKQHDANEHGLRQ